LPTDRPRPAVRRYVGAEAAVELGAVCSAAVHRLAREERATPFMVLLAAYYLLLARYSNQNDICVATPVAGRERA